jgi:hypothetical protein
MATYTAITDAEIDQDSPITQTLMTKYRDNLTAVIEGDPSAPSILDNIANKTTAGGVGSYALLGLATKNVTVLYGATRAGSDLHPMGFATSDDNTFNDNSVTIAPFYGRQSSARSGTWRCMGVARSAGSESASASLWLRIS